ncbi:glycosyltransferase family 2 protein [Horticoccus luteus]|uniref:Glycosyltransferase family 2 protein n=1 Tax=Horticoccus luteus TaxID=2862869 RepID=A0A8F9TVK8_9BACT|nr:glycosyltransferase family A protein [Horticoccus luteus]QYM78392.1 glycosyltransferase family 2 protein [Horticoccus luteus]
MTAAADHPPPTAPVSSPDTRPALTVIMPAYNAGRYLIPAIESVLSQTWRDFEFIIIDDGSTDGTRERIEDYALRDARIRDYPNAKNIGVTRSLNRAISLARADWIARMDADDISLPTRFEKQMAVVRADPSIGLVTSPFDVIDAQQRRIPGWRGIRFQQEMLPFFLLFYNRLNAHGQVLYSTSLVRSLGGYREKYHLSEATELWLRMVRATRWAVVPEPLYLWRADNPHSVSRQHAFRYADASLLACREEIARACNIDVSKEEMIALRDFWLRCENKDRNWDDVENLLLRIAARFHPPHPVPHWRRKLAIALGCAWFAQTIQHAKRHRTREALRDLGRGLHAAGGYLPLALAQFVRETFAVKAQLSRRA